ncbi:MAG: exodeoxyribonuclease VII small subunit [Bacteroidetes bacterium]|nr:exodeoxyribonuclease VII small subunit [Bacteroidota bacterium]
MKDFEKSLARLEEINESIKDAGLPLEKSIALFEEGLKIAKRLEADLKKVEQKVEILINSGDSPDPDPDKEPEFGLFSG